MTRNLKVLGLALVSVFAIGAVGASGASAQAMGTFTSTGKWVGTATEKAGTVNALTGFGFTTSCPGSTRTINKLQETPHTPVPNDVSAVTVSVHWATNNCRTNPGNFPTTVDMNGCSYDLRLGSTTGTADQYFATSDVTCPVNAQITWTIFTTEAKETENKPFCKLHIGAQENLTGARVKDLTNGNVELTGAIEKTKATKTNGGEDPLLCAASETTEAKYDINMVVSARNEAGETTPISISHL